MPQEINFNQFETVSTILVNQAGFYGIPRRVAQDRLEKYLGALQLWEKRNAVSRTLSGGMKRRLMIARALMHEPRLLILDEPTAGVDIEVRRTMWTFMRDINAAGTTIILTTHYLEEAESLCRNVAIIDKGHIIENDRMSRVLRKLQTEVFVLNLRNPIAAAAGAAGLHRDDARRSHARSRSVEGTEPQRHLLASHCSRHRSAVDADQDQPTGGAVHAAGGQAAGAATGKAAS